MTAHFSFVSSQVRAEVQQAVCWAVSTKADPKRYWRRIGNGHCFSFCKFSAEASVRKSRWQAEEHWRLLMKTLADISVIHVTMLKLLLESPSVEAAFLSLERLLFGLSGWVVCCFFLWTFGMLSIDAIQGKIWHKFWTHSHINHICERIQHAAFAHAKKAKWPQSQLHKHQRCKYEYEPSLPLQVERQDEESSVNNYEEGEGGGKIHQKKVCALKKVKYCPLVAPSCCNKLLLCKQHPQEVQNSLFLNHISTQRLAVLDTTLCRW